MKQLLSLLSLMLFVAVGTPTYAQGDKPSSNEIWYTTRGGKVVNPNNPEALGSKILSNTYRNGKGVIIVEADSIVKIGSLAFRGCRSLTSITIPDSVTAIGKYAFYKCTSLTRVTIGNGVTSIGMYAFYGCSSLTSITIPDSVTWIGNHAFYGCYSLTSVTIGNGVTSIRERAFYGCSSLTSITIPDSVTSIGSDAFSGCTSLKEVYCKPTTPPSAGNFYLFYHMFYDNASGRKIYVPRSSVNAYKKAEYWNNYAYNIVGYDF